MTRKSWQLWPGQGWPFSRKQEADFVAELAARTTPAPFGSVDRDAISILLMIFRCGTPIEEVSRLAPGLPLGRILTAYQTLEAARMDAVLAWEHIEDCPSSSSLWESAEKASLVLPVVTHTILSKTMSTGASKVVEEIAEASAGVHRIMDLASRVEAALDDIAYMDPRGVELGTQLYNPVSPGIYSSPHYLPDRVSSLTPLRVRDLLGENQR